MSVNKFNIVVSILKHQTEDILYKVRAWKKGATAFSDQGMGLEGFREQVVLNLVLKDNEQGMWL